MNYITRGNTSALSIAIATNKISSTDYQHKRPRCADCCLRICNLLIVFCVDV